MDREISKEVQRKEQRKQFIRIGTAVGGFIVLIVVVIFRPALNGKTSIFRQSIRE